MAGRGVLRGRVGPVASVMLAYQCYAVREGWTVAARRRMKLAKLIPNLIINVDGVTYIHKQLRPNSITCH